MFAKSAQLKIAPTPANGIMLDSNVIAVPHLKSHYTFSNATLKIETGLLLAC